MQTYRIEQFMHKPWDQWPCKENERFAVELQDGVVFTTDTAKMELSSTMWQFYKDYKLLKAVPEHFVQHAPVSNKDIQALQSRFIKDIHRTYHPRGYNKEDAWLSLQATSEEIYNKCILEHGEYMVSAGAPEQAEVYFHPEIVKIREGIKPNSKSIVAAQKAALKVMKTCPTLARNPFIIDLRTGNVKAEQFLQIVLVRGFNTDLDGHIYRVPIMGNYFAGITDPAEVMMESTLAGKALLHQGAPLEQTEYANRMIQQSSAHVDLLIQGDCKIANYSELEITPSLFERMLGKYFIDTDNGDQLRPLEEEDGDLVGRKFKFRTAFYCGFRHYQAVCETCFGDLAHSIPHGQNLGTVAATNSNSEVSQAVLKVKHSEDSADIEPILISARAAEFIHLSDDEEDIHVNKSVGERGIKLLISTVAKNKLMLGSKLPVMDFMNISENDIHNITEFDMVSVEVPAVDDTKRPTRYHIAVSRGNRRSSLTVEFLNYMGRSGAKINDDGAYEVDLAKWDHTLPVFRLPRLHLSMQDFAREVLTMIRSGSETSGRDLSKTAQLRDYTDPTRALVDLTELFNSKVTVHMTHVEVVMLSMMVSRSGEYGYNTPPLGVPTRFATYTEIQTNRSLGSTFAYQGGAEQVNRNIQQSLNTDRPQHLYDPLLML